MLNEELFIEEWDNLDKVYSDLCRVIVEKEFEFTNKANRCYELDLRSIANRLNKSLQSMMKTIDNLDKLEE